MNTTILLWVVLSAAPKVDAVVVYPDRAQVTRRAEVACQSGTTSVTFEGIPPAADQTTFRAAARGATVEGLRSEQRTRDDAYSAELAKTEAALRKADDELRALDDEAARIQSRSELGTQYEGVAVQLISRDMALAKPETKVWATAFDHSLNARLDAAAQVADLQRQRRALQWRREDLHRVQARLQAAAARTEYLAEVLLKCPAGRSARVELTYLVGGASWAPAYEARSEEPSSVALTTYATVSQRTGEDWKDAKIILSTAIPAQDATPPEIHPLRVFAQEQEDKKKVLVRRDERIQHAQSGSMVSGAGQPQNLAAKAQGLSVQLEVQRPEDVPGDGTPVRLMVGRAKLPAKFAWRTVPAMAPFVFRVADLTNAAPYPLLEGPLDAFGRSGFIGRYALERVPVGGAFHLTFGIEDRAKVERSTIEEIRRASGLFNQRKRFHYAYRFEVANHADKAMTLQLQDRVPVSEMDDVEVAIDGKQTTAGYRLHPQDGTVTWDLKLAAHEKKRVELHFHVDVPDSYDTGGM